MKKALRLSLCCGLLIMASWQRGPTVSDTGYLGTWSRGNDRVTSVISICRLGEEYRFRLSVASRDGGRELECDWGGRCAGFSYGEKTADYQFRTWLDRETEHLMVEYEVSTLQPAELESHYLDELVVEQGGLALTAYTVERDGQEFELRTASKRVFKKVADAVESPPSPEAS